MKQRASVSSGVVLALLILAGCAAQGDEKRLPQLPQMPQVTVGNEMAAITRLRSIGIAETQYQIDSGGRYATLDELIAARLVGDPSEGKLTNYRFAVKIKPGGFEATAVPLKYGVSGKRSFYLDETRMMHGADKKGAEATASDPAI
jgi:hypothetical protein